MRFPLPIPAPIPARGSLAVAIVVTGLFTMRAMTGCLDVTPIVVVHDASRATVPCVSCLERANACAPLIDECKATETRCPPIYACMAASCLDLPTLDDKIRCGLPCAQEGGVTSVDDPIVGKYMVGLIECAREKCTVQCNIQDASVNL